MKATVKQILWVAALSSLLAGGCGNDAISFERPCAATFYDNDVLSDTATYTWDGNKLRSIVYTEVNGGVSNTSFEYEGDKEVRRTTVMGVSIATQLRTYDATGRLISLTYTSSDNPEVSSSSTYTYDSHPIPSVEVEVTSAGETIVSNRVSTSMTGSLETRVQRCISWPDGGEACDEIQETWGLQPPERFLPSLAPDYPSRFGAQLVAFTTPTFQSIFTWQGSQVVSMIATQYPAGEVTYVHTKTMDGPLVVAEETDEGGKNYKVSYSYDCP